MIIIFKLIATIMIISAFCLGGNQLLWECNIIPENIYERLGDKLSYVIAWIVIVFVVITGIMLIIIMWTRM